MKEAWEKWVQKEIYGGNVKPGYIFPTEGSHYQAFKAEEIYGGNVKPGYIFPTEGSHYQAFKAGWEAANGIKSDE